MPIIYWINVCGIQGLNFNCVIHHPVIELILNIELKRVMEAGSLFFPPTTT